jgi:hypothetical protein
MKVADRVKILAKARNRYVGLYDLKLDVTEEMLCEAMDQELALLADRLTRLERAARASHPNAPGTTVLD